MGAIQLRAAVVLEEEGDDVRIKEELVVRRPAAPRL
jgi:hypothetical protein